MRARVDTRLLARPRVPARAPTHANARPRAQVWAALAARSVARYGALEAASGVTFHTPCGYLAIGHHAGKARDRYHSEPR